MRLILLLVVGLLVYDAIANDSATTKKLWNDVVDFFDGGDSAKAG